MYIYTRSSHMCCNYSLYLPLSKPSNNYISTFISSLLISLRYYRSKMWMVHRSSMLTKNLPISFNSLNWCWLYCSLSRMRIECWFSLCKYCLYLSTNHNNNHSSLWNIQIWLHYKWSWLCWTLSSMLSLCRSQINMLRIR